MKRVEKVVSLLFIVLASMDLVMKLHELTTE